MEGNQEIPINFLKAGVCGCYMKIEKDRRQYCVEIPCFFMGEIHIVERRMEGTLPPALLVFEEAHRFVPSGRHSNCIRC
jgi:hypothetical protein